jgi:hypothetical protein
MPRGRRDVVKVPTGEVLVRALDWSVRPRLAGVRQRVLVYGLDDRSGLPVLRSTGTETCSWMINQLPSILR